MTDQTAIIHSLLEELTQRGAFSGSVLLTKRGETILSSGYGMADVEQGIPNTSKTKFRIGSVTKSFTAAAVLQLVGQGRIGLDDPIGPYFPRQTGGDRITIRHLLNHTSGLPNYTDNPLMMEWVQHAASPEEVAARFCIKELDFEPGSQFTYCNSGYVLLGLLMEKLTGKSYSEIIRDHLLEPLGMKSTEAEISFKEDSLFATGYEYDGAHTLVKAPFFHASNAYAAGSIISTVEDLLLWDYGLETNTILSKTLTEQMFTAGGPSIPYGFGWFIQNTPFGTMIQHSGGVTGFYSLFMKFPQSKVTIIILSNIAQDVIKTGKELAAILHKE